MFFVAYFIKNNVIFLLIFTKIHKIKFMKQLLIALLFAFGSILLQAQTYNVKGVVTDAVTGETLPGVNVVVKNTTKGDISDFDGNYSLTNVPKGSILVFSYLGYQAKEAIVDKEIINIILEESSEKLDEIVVVGYGTQRKKEVTGAIEVISSQTIEDLNPTRIEQAIQGQVAGVNITSTSGAPGAGLNIRFRGVSTNGDSRPLILLDGAVIEDLSVVNPNDVESINFLKDATAGIYGVRAANGVILITTKSGRKETDFQFNISMNTGFQQTTRKIPLLNATEYALLANEAFAANGEALPFPNVSDLGQGTNWQNEVFENAPIYNVDMGFTKGTEKATYALTISAFDQEGIVGREKARFNRRTIKFDYTRDITKNLKFSTSTIYANTNRFTLIENALGSVLFNALNMPSNLGVNDQAPTTGVGIEVVNPIHQAEATFNRATANRITLNYGLTYSFLDHFTAEARMQLNHAGVVSRNLFPEADFGAGKVFNRTLAEASFAEQRFTDYTFDAFVKYERVFDEVHDLKVLLGTSFFQTTGINIANRTNFGGSAASLAQANFDIIGSQNNLTLFNVPRLFFDSRLQSFFSRVQYSYKGKYLLSGILRRDGSSNFGPNNRFGIFYGASGGWIVSDESFLEDNETIDFLKLRGSYGVIGNDRIPGNRFVSLLDGEGAYVFNNQIFIVPAAIGGLSNPNIRWEKQITTDFGVEFGLFNKVDVDLGYYYRKTEDLLIQPQTSLLLGGSAPGSAPPVVNAGSVRNSGYEFSLSYADDIGENAKFSLNYNFATVDNKVLFVGSDTGFEFGGTFGVGQEIDISRMQAGLPIGYFHGLQTNGIFQTQAEVASSAQPDATPGDIRFVDLNNDGTIDDNDRTYLGDPIPDITMGLNFTFEYKQLDFVAYGFASFGNQIVRNYERTTPLTNRTIYDLDRWTGLGTSNTVPRVTTGATTNTLFSDYYIEDGDFIRIQNVQIGYSFGEETLKATGFDKFRVYISGNNIFTFTKYRGFDPSATSGAPIGGGIDQGFYPVPRTFLLGLNIKL